MFRERVVAEKKELDDKIFKLISFIKTDPRFWLLPSVEKSLLMKQQRIMGEYSETLRERIALFPSV